MIIRINTGESRARLAETWFKFLGFVGLTTVIHAAAQTTANWGLAVLTLVCYIVMFGWVEFRVDSLIWRLFPSVDPTSESVDHSRIPISVGASATIMIGVYLFAISLVEVLSSLSG